MSRVILHVLLCIALFTCQDSTCCVLAVFMSMYSDTHLANKADSDTCECVHCVFIPCCCFFLRLHLAAAKAPTSAEPLCRLKGEGGTKLCRGSPAFIQITEVYILCNKNEILEVLSMYIFRLSSVTWRSCWTSSLKRS